MYRLICCALFLFCTSHVSAAIVITLKGPGNVSTVPVPLTGGTYDISINFTRAPTGDPPIGGFQFDVQADTAGFATLNGANPPGGNPSGVAGNATTGTRYNDPEWSADISENGFAFNPNDAAGPLSSIPRGPLGSMYMANSGAWDTTSSLFGFLNITMAPGNPGQTVLVETANAVGIDAAGPFEDIPAANVGVTFQYVPEPGNVLLMGIGLVPLLRRKRRIL